MQKPSPFSSSLFYPDADDPEGASHGVGHAHESPAGHHEKPHAADEQRHNRTEHRAREAYAAHEDGKVHQERRTSIGGLIPEEPHTGKGEPQDMYIDDETLAVMGKMRLCPQCPEKKDAEETRLRALADLDNARKRVAREREEHIRFAAESVLADIIPSLDNMDLALQHAGTEDVCKGFVTGVDMTRRLLLDALKKHGLEQVGAVGDVFDPARHEAVGMADAPEVPNGAICALLAPGYTLRDRLLRPARVTVCRKN